MGIKPGPTENPPTNRNNTAGLASHSHIDNTTLGKLEALRKGLRTEEERVEIEKEKQGIEEAKARNRENKEIEDIVSRRDGGGKVSDEERARVTQYNQRMTVETLKKKLDEAGPITSGRGPRFESDKLADNRDARLLEIAESRGYGPYENPIDPNRDGRSYRDFEETLALKRNIEQRIARFDKDKEPTKSQEGHIEANIKRIGDIILNGGVPGEADANFVNEHEERIWDYVVTHRKKEGWEPKPQKKKFGEWLKGADKKEAQAGAPKAVEPKPDLNALVERIVNAEANSPQDLQDRQNYKDEVDKLLVERFARENREIEKKESKGQKDPLVSVINEVAIKRKSGEEFTDEERKAFYNNRDLVEKRIAELDKAYQGSMEVAKKWEEGEFSSWNDEEKIENLALFLRDGGKIRSEKILEFYKSNKKEVDEEVRAQDKSERHFEKAISKVGQNEQIPGRQFRADISPEGQRRAEILENARRKIEAGEANLEFDAVAKKYAKDNPATPAVTEVSDKDVKDAMKKMNLVSLDFKNHSPDFLNLAPGQQLYVLEKLRQKINLDASLKADDKVDAVLNSKVKFFSKEGWNKLKFKFTKEFQQAKAKKDIIKGIKESGLQGYEGDLKTLSSHVLELGLPIRYVDGKLLIEYESAEALKNAPEYSKRFGKDFDPARLTEEFNLAATALSEIPYEWTTPQATFDQKRKYEKALNDYEKKKTVFGGARLEELRAGLDKDVPQAEFDKRLETSFKIWSDSIDSTVKMNRLLTSHPEISDWEEDPKLRPNLRKTANFFANLGAWTKGSGAVVIGAGARWLSRSSLTFGGAAVVVGALGGYLNYRQKTLEYEDKERKNRYGARVEQKGLKKNINVQEFTQKIEKLLVELEKAEASGNPKEIDFIAGKLKNRLFVLNAGVDEGRVDFGNQKEMLVSMTKMEQIVAEANNRIFMAGGYNDSPVAAEILKRFEASVLRKDKAANWAKNKDRLIHALKGAGIAAGGFAIGYGIKDAFGLIGTDKDVSERIEEIISDGGDSPDDDVKPGFRRSVPPEDQLRPNISPDTSAVEEADTSSVELPTDTTVTDTTAFEQPADTTKLEVPSGDSTIVKDPVPPEAKAEFENLKKEKLADGFQHAKSGEGDIFSKDQPLETAADSTAKAEAAPDTTESRLAKEVKDNVREIKDIAGNVVDMEIRNPTKVEDVMKFRKNAGNFLIDDMSKTDLPENKQTRGWGINALNRVKNQAQEYLAWKDYIKAYPEGSDKHEWISREMTRLGEDIRAKAGPIFAPYEAVAEPMPVVEPENANSIPREDLERIFGTNNSNTEASAIEAFQAAQDSNITEPAGFQVGGGETIVIDQAPSGETPVGEPVIEQPSTRSPGSYSMEVPDIDRLVNEAENPFADVKVNEDVVTKSIEDGNLRLDFDSDKVEGELTFVEKDGRIEDIEESRDFHTEAGRTFMKNPEKLLSTEDVDKMIDGLEEDGIKMNKRQVLRRFEDFIDKREALRESGLSLESAQAMALKKDMAATDVLFENYTGHSVMERLNLVESGKSINAFERFADVAENAEASGAGENVLGLDMESKLVSSAAKKYGEASMAGNELQFKNGYVGFYGESLDQAEAMRKANAFANLSETQKGGVVDQIMTQKDGKYRYLSIYKKL